MFLLKKYFLIVNCIKGYREGIKKSFIVILGREIDISEILEIN